MTETGYTIRIPAETITPSPAVLRLTLQECLKVREPVVKRYCMNVLLQNLRSRQPEVGIFKPGLSSHDLARRVEETQQQAMTLPHSVSGLL